jgi:biotin carboxyl carrier protein
MPGTILSINVSAGQSVNKGQVLLVLEAMKMENEITAPENGVVARILTSSGASVATGQPLISMQ